MFYNELLLQYTNQTHQNGIYTWQTPNTVILGAKDTRLSKLTDGLNYLQNQDYQIFLRSSGGLAVISDPGILNISYFHHQSKKLSIDDAYLMMFELIKSFWPTANIKAKEIPNSYCPGKYDLSIDNFKIAGLSQKRYQETTAIMAYISLNGNQQKRGLDISYFYQKAQADSTYPHVDPNVMKNLSDFNLNINNWQTKLTSIVNREENTTFKLWLKQQDKLSDYLKQKINHKQKQIRK